MNRREVIMELLRRLLADAQKDGNDPAVEIIERIMKLF